MAVGLGWHVIAAIKSKHLVSFHRQRDLIAGPDGEEQLAYA
jgi:hypothetical protein